MRACVLGGGLAGAMLSWRLASAAAGWRIDVVAGRQVNRDATKVSGGAVRAFETDPVQRARATASLLELTNSKTLRDWSGYQPVDTVYLTDEPGLSAAVAELNTAFVDSVELLSTVDLQRRGWAGLPDGAAAVLERHSGYTAPDRFRTALLTDALARPGVLLLDADATAIRLNEDDSISCVVGGVDRVYDIVVIAAGPWTGHVLRSNGLPAGGFRTKSIQYSIYPVADWCPSEFVDEHTGLFGRPTIDGRFLLGLPTDEWDADPDRPVVTPALHTRAAATAAWRFPRLHLGVADLAVAATDCYCDRQMLTLRPVVDSDHRLFTFTGGSGGSVKTLLAASTEAAQHVLELDNRTAPVTPLRMLKR
jgi:glycine/D-amino acid oxidase-like deaminating enzyme